VKKLFLGILLLAAAASGLAFQTGQVRVQEVDGSPAQLVRTIVFPNGSRSCSGGNCTHSGLSASIAGAEGADGTLTLSADESDDNGDDWTIQSDQATNDLIIGNDTSGSDAAKLTIQDTTGDVTLTGDIINENADSLLMNTDDVIVYSSNDENATIRALGFEAKTAALQLFADQDDDATDGWYLTATTAGTLTIGNDSGAAGTSVTKLTMTGSSGLLTLVGGIAGDGGDTIVGFLKSRVAATATTLTIAQCGATIYNSGAVQIELPEASTALGCRYTFVTANAANFDVNPDNADQILVATNAAGDAIRNATLGNSITIEATSASEWTEVAIIGTWSDIN
jgi:hypothetical protein